MTKVYKVSSEGDLEEAVKMFTALAMSSKKRKKLSLWFPTEALSDIFLQAAYTDFSLRNIPPQPDMNIQIYIEGDPDDKSD
jgi:hypothetical protein